VLEKEGGVHEINEIVPLEIVPTPVVHAKEQGVCKKWDICTNLLIKIHVLIAHGLTFSTLTPTSMSPGGIWPVDVIPLNKVCTTKPAKERDLYTSLLWAC
jgi:hypothetical protein